MKYIQISVGYVLLFVLTTFLADSLISLFTVQPIQLIYKVVLYIGIITILKIEPCKNKNNKNPFCFLVERRF